MLRKSSRPASLISRSAASRSKKSQVRPIEESLLGIGESTLEQAQAKCTVGDIGDRHNRNALGRQVTCRTLQDRCRVPKCSSTSSARTTSKVSLPSASRRFFGFEIGDEDAIADL